LVVHGLLVLVAVRVSPRKIEAPPQPLEIELQEAPPPPPAAAAPPEPVGPPAPLRPAAPERRPRQATAPSAPSVPSPAPEAAPEGPADPSLLRMRPPKLSLDDATVDRFEREGVITSTPLPETAPAGRGKSKWQQKLAMLERDTEGRKNVLDGKVHPQVYDFMRDAQKIFKPRESVVEKDPRNPNTVGRSMRAWTRGFFRNYLDQLRKLELEEPTRKGRMAEGGTDLMAEYNRLLRAAEKGSQAIACQVCLVIRPGQPPEVVLTSSSGNKEVDEAATDAVTRAALRRPYEKDLKPERACYRFAATVYRIPPLPIAGCGFDEVKMKLNCFYPGMQVYKLDVKLDLVDYSGG
jgi:outer membrane biosynthesis protein TonB